MHSDLPYSSKNSIVMKPFTFILESKSDALKRIFHNEAICSKTSKSSKKCTRTISWLRSRTRESSVSGFRMDSTPRKNSTPTRKHFIASPYGVIMRGKKLKQRYDIGGIFRENVELDFRSAIVRNQNNMRAKWK